MSKTNSSAMRTIRWGILGTGNIAALFAEALLALGEEGARLVAVGSRTRASAETFGREFGVPHVHGSYEELARDAEVDVVYVATPNSLHEAHCLLLLDHGKAVLCEKPFALDASQAQTIIDAARKKKLFCMEGMWMRFVPIVTELRALLRKGAIGDVRAVNAQLGFPWEHDPKHRLFDPALGGGAMLDLGVYPLSLAFHLLGRPTKIQSQAAIGKTGIDEQSAALLTFDEDRQASIVTSIRTRTSNDATIMGTEGVIHLHAPIYCPEHLTIEHTAKLRGENGVRPKRTAVNRLKQKPLARELQSILARAKSKTVTKRALGNGYTHEAIEVMRCMREGALESPIMPLDESRAILEAVDTMRGQWATGAKKAKAK